MLSRRRLSQGSKPFPALTILPTIITHFNPSQPRRQPQRWAALCRLPHVRGSLCSPLTGTQACALKLSPPSAAASAGGYLPHRGPNWPTVALWSFMLLNDFCFHHVQPSLSWDLRFAKTLARLVDSWLESIHYSKGRRPQQYLTRAWLQCNWTSCI